MPDDLDDGEIPAEAPTGTSSTVAQASKINHETGQGRSESRPDVVSHDRRMSASQRDRDASSNDRDQPRASPAHAQDRSTIEPPTRPRASEAKKAPSIYDAHTKADLGRLAREAEAAAYKARTSGAAAKGAARADTRGPRTSATTTPRQYAPNRPLSPRRSASRTRSRSPEYSRRRGDRRSPSPIARPRARSPMRSRSPMSSRPYGDSRVARDMPPRDATLADSARRKPLSAADIGRMEREREAAAYKAKVLGDAAAAKAKQADGDSHSKTQSGHSISTAPALSRAHSSKTADSPMHTSSRTVADPPKEVVQRIQSRTPRLDQQLAALKNEYDTLTKSAMTQEIALASALQKWVNAERELKREEYKTLLAQQSLEATTIL